MASGSASAATYHSDALKSTRTTLTSSGTTSVYGQSVHFTATVVAASGSGTPTGVVQFLDGSKKLGTGKLSKGESTFTITFTGTLAPLSVGTHQISAIYVATPSGGTWKTSTSNVLARTISKASTTTALVSTLNPAVFGQSVTLTAYRDGRRTICRGHPKRLGSVSTTARRDSPGSVWWRNRRDRLEAGLLPLSRLAKAAFLHLTWALTQLSPVYSGSADFKSSTAKKLNETIIKVVTTTTSTTSTTTTTLGAAG